MKQTKETDETVTNYNDLEREQHLRYLSDQSQQMGLYELDTNSNQLEITDDDIKKIMHRYNITDFGQKSAFTVGVKWVVDLLNTKINQLPDVRKMVEWIDKEILLNPHYADSPRLREGANIVKVKLQQYTPTSSQTEISDENAYTNGYLHGYNAAIAELPKEISDEDIEQYAKKNAFQYYEFITGAKWYREQLKQRQ